MTTFVIHHVGARFGNTPFPLPAHFRSDIDLVLFDADEECVEGLGDPTEKEGERQRIVAACLSDTDGEEEFRFTINASGSSLLEPSQAVRGFVQPLFGIDWDVVGGSAVIERRPLRVWRLDTLLATHTDIPRPDFLPLDTQGSEAAIISGAVESIRRGVVGLIVEVEFVELYRNVPRFGSIAGHLEAEGFHFAGFRDMIDAQASCQSLGHRSDGFPVAADALFLRRIDSIRGPSRTDRLLRLAFAAIVFGFLDHAFAALDAADPLSRSAEMPAWLDFVIGLHHSARKIPKLFPPRFPDILPTREIRRFAREPDIAKWPEMMDLRAWQAEQESRGLPVSQALDALEMADDSLIEAHLRSHGFVELADRTQFCRRDQAHKLRKFLHQSSSGRLHGAPKS